MSKVAAAKSNPQVMIVGTQAERRRQAAAALEAVGFITRSATSATDAIQSIDHQLPAAVVCLWPFRGLQSQYALLHQLRERDWRLLIAVVGVAIEAQSVREVLDAGADLCFPDSYDIDTLAVHMEAGLQRRGATTATTLTAGDLTIDTIKRQTWRGLTEIDLTPSEFRLLTSLVKHQGEAVAKNTLLEECWRRYDDVRSGGGHLVEVHISALRRKLHDAGPPIIFTIHSYGFALRPAD